MVVAGLYRRALPSPPAIEFASAPGKQLFAEALEKGNMEGFFQLISYYQTQSEPAYCGLASLAMVLNALAIDPGRKWKGPWRWFDDSMLDCCEPLEKVKVTGVTFGNVACLAHCNGAKVESFRTNESTIADFRKLVILCTSSEDCHVITSYHRAHLEQTGTGHFSPIGGYHADSDMVLILDVARFKYPPHWVPLSLLWKAMDTLDKTTGQYRGFMIISRPHSAPSALYIANCRNESWRSCTKYLLEDVPLLLKSEDIKVVKEVVSAIFTLPPSNMGEFIKWVAEVRRQEDQHSSLSEEEKGRVTLEEEALKQVRETELFKHVTRFLACENLNACCQGAELLTGKIGSSDRSCCGATNMKVLKANGEKPITMVSATAVGGSEQVVDVLVPSTETTTTTTSNCSGVLPSTGDLLTVILLALPHQMWSGIKEEKLRDEIFDLVLTDNLPPLLQAEVLHLRRQLHLLKRCQDNKVDEDLGAPFF